MEHVIMILLILSPSFCMLLVVGIVSADLSTCHELQQCILYTSEMINLILQLGCTQHTTFFAFLLIFYNNGHLQVLGWYKSWTKWNKWVRWCRFAQAFLVFKFTTVL